MVVISNPQKGKIYGGAVAAPVFRAIADRIYATSLGVKDEIPKIAQTVDLHMDDSLVGLSDLSVKGWLPDLAHAFEFIEGEKTSTQVSEGWAEVFMKNGRPSIQSISLPRNKVPDVRGMTARDATYLLEACGLRVSLNGRGRVKDQSLPAGTPVLKGADVRLTLSCSL